MALAVACDDQVTRICSHCERAIPYSNLDLHFAHCSRNLEKCKLCGDMVPKKGAAEHFMSTHGVTCSLCSETMDRNLLDVHRGENCLQRIVTCEYCELPLPAIDLLEHQEVCGNRTELCHVCRKYIRLREMHGHESICNGVNNTAESSSRNDSPPPRRQPHEFSPRRVLFTIATIGIAILLGSLFSQRKPNHSRGHAR